MIKNIYIKTNVLCYNAHHDKDYKSKKGVLIIEYTDRENSILEIESMSDISKSNYITIKDTKKTKIKYIFRNLSYNTELLKKLAQGK